MWLVIILLIFLLLIFIPIPIKFQLIYKENNFKAYIYNKLVFNFKERKKKSIKKESTPPNTSSKKKFSSILKPDIKTTLGVLYENPLKPNLGLSINIEYCLDDAANTALLYGTFHNIFAVTGSLLSSVFKIKYLDNKIIPLFNNTNTFFINLKGIIFINLAKVIYIFFLYIIRKK